MTKTIIVLLTLVLTTTVAFFFLSYKKMQNERLLIAHKRDSIQRIQDDFADFVESSAVKFDLTKCSLVDKNYDTIADIRQLFKSRGNKLVIFFSDRQCVDCQMKTLELLKTLSDKQPLSDALIISKYANFSQLKRLLSKASVSIEAYNIVTEIFPDNIVNSNAPYFFMLDSSLNVVSLLKHDTDMPVMTVIYINSLNKHFL